MLITIVILTVVMVVENIIDIILTNKIIKAGGIELNPVMRYAIDKFGDRWHYTKFALAIIAIICVAILYLVGLHKTALLFILCIDILYVFVLKNNWKESRVEKG